MIPSHCYIRRFLLKELRNASNKRVENYILPFHNLLENRLCHTSNGDEPEKPKSKEPEKSDVKEKSKHRLNNLLQSFHEVSFSSNDDESEKSKSKEPEKGDVNEKAKHHLNDTLQSFHKKSYAPHKEIGIYKAKPVVRKAHKEAEIDENESVANRLCHTSNIDEPEKPKSEEPEKSVVKEKAKHRLNDLLQAFHEKSYAPHQEIGIYKAKPVVRKAHKEAEIDENESVDFSLRDAAKKVANSIGGDVAETESELLLSLRTHASPENSLRDIISNMQVSKSKQFPDDRSTSESVPRSRLYEFRQGRGTAASFASRDRNDINVFAAPPLKIFPKDYEGEGNESILSTWDAALEREKKLCVNNQPRNYFEEMIKWTEEGKVWTFPIDNEIGLKEEKAVSFAEHIFLEKHLKGWCPSKGPISQFMELVCVGLSKNPYITVERKKAHIEWYKNYFESKADLLKDLGAM